jgi:hypothetical protein
MSLKAYAQAWKTFTGWRTAILALRLRLAG